jgi:hypothetical protein
MIKVYHNPDFLKYQFEPYVVADALDYLKLKARISLRMCARVDTDDLDVAFEKTNHISAPWYDNEGVFCYDRKARSTSVGDFMLMDDGTIYIVEGVGFRKIEVG